MIRRMIGAVVLVLGALALVGPVSPASAGGGSSDYADCTVQIAPSQFAAGRMVTVIGRGFEPNFYVEYVDHRDPRWICASSAAPSAWC